MADEREGNTTFEIISPGEERVLEQYDKPQNGSGEGNEEGEGSYEVEIVRAFSDFLVTDTNQLSFKSGDELKVLQKTTDEWWWAERDGCHGYIPVSYVRKAELREREEWQDEEYFQSYSTLKLQQEMLSDFPRMSAFHTAIEKNAAFIKDKVVLDVGCGTGILSLFCAKYGKARKVYAVERSDTAQTARRLVQHNGYCHVIKVIEDLVEDIDLQEKVDIIISEWMGTALLFEMMIESVIVSRDLFLSCDGVMWPSQARLHLVPCSAHQVYKEKVKFWGEHFGIDFTPLRENALDEYLSKPLHNHQMAAEEALSDPVTVFLLDMKTVTVEELELIEQTLDFKVTKSEELHGFCSWFSVDFGGDPEIQEVVTLNTGPQHPLTHWKQNLFLLDEPRMVEVGDRITGKFTLRRNAEYRRHLHITLDLSILADREIKENISKRFKIWR